MQVSIKYLDTSFIPWRRADETIDTVLVENSSGEPDLYFIHLSPQGFYSVFGSMHDLLDYVVNGNNEHRLFTTDKEDEIELFFKGEFTA